MSEHLKSEPSNPAIEQRFLASVSHEIRTPLNGILGMASLLAETELTAAQADYVSAIRQSGARLLDLLNNVLDYARMDAAGVELEFSDIEIGRLAQDVLELLSPRAHEKGLDLCLRIAPDIPQTCRLDDGRTRQILFNLVGNAIKFTEFGGVLVDVKRKNENLILRVIDSGPGLSNADQEKLFSAFQQTDSSHRGKDGGVGLGLTIVKRLVHAMNGDIQIVSDIGLGACFELSLPVLDGEDTPHHQIVSPAKKPLRIGLQGLTNPLILSLTSMLEDAGHTALIGDDIRVDVWIADASLPPRLLKEHATNAPLITLIRPEDRSQIDNLRSMGSSAYLMRPVRQSSLIAQLEAITSSGSFTEKHDEVELEQGEEARVLVADDNAVNALLATRTLEKAGYTCMTAATGAEALEAIEQNEFHLILMDLRMPVMDGYEAMRQVRNLKSEKNQVPMIAVSAEVNPEVERKARKAGANGVASKPLDAQTLRRLAGTWRRKAGMNDNIQCR